ncbi:hypothetical protein [Corynebacterium sp. NML120713]|uniref:hypothetical protein n=1 Tax=Corynebacterium sp. NML120713 TaxID=1906332 RepID=UPI0008FBA22B|nr:hypothetical protein [Corynebacterium sp. NML120713]OIR43191.1 hypothetical protein BJP06_06320 [Corynebacterium sp. NML120713]
MSTFIHISDLHSAIENAMGSNSEAIFGWDVIGFSEYDVLGHITPSTDWYEVREADEGFTLDDTENGYVYPMENLNGELEYAFRSISEDPESYCSFPLYSSQINLIFERYQSECEDLYADDGYDANSDFSDGGVQRIINNAVWSFVRATFSSVVMDILEDVKKELG